MSTSPAYCKHRSMTTSYETQPWVKLLSSIVTSSIWAEDPATKVVWITLLALMDARTGYVGGSVPGLAQVAGVTAAEAQRAIDKFLAPDPHSRDLTANPEGEGRRIVRADGGWIVLNAAKIRNMRQAEVRREQNREAQRRRRAAVSKCQQKPADRAPLADMCAMSAHAEADTDSRSREASQLASAVPATGSDPRDARTLESARDLVSRVTKARRMP